MQGNFIYHNPTKLYFGEESLNYLRTELNNFGNTVLLNYGNGSVKRNGIYEDVVSTTVIFPAGYLNLQPEDIKQILKESL